MSRSESLAPAGRYAAPAADRSAFEELIGRYFAAWSPGAAPFDIAAAEPFYLQNDDLTAYDFGPPVEGVRGWRAYRRVFQAIMEANAEFRAAPRGDLGVFRAGDVAWTVAGFDAAGRTRKGEPIDAAGRVSLVWVRDGERWVIAHEHVSIPIGER